MSRLSGVRVLVVEDDALIGMLIEDILLDEGCHICGPHITLGTGMDEAKTEAIDIAVLDVNLAGKQSYPIAEALVARGIPFVLASGYGEGGAPPDHPEWPVCAKPFTPQTLTSALVGLIAKPRVDD
jgi:two-component SAPR family response regulator